MQDITGALESIHLQITLIGVSLQLNIVLRGEGWLSIVLDPKFIIVMYSALLRFYLYSNNFWQRFYLYYITAKGKKKPLCITNEALLLKNMLHCLD